MNAPAQEDDELHFIMDDERRIWITSRGVGKSHWNAEMMRRIWEAEAAKPERERVTILIMDECRSVPGAVWDALSKQLTLDRALQPGERMTVIDGVPLAVGDRVLLKNLPALETPVISAIPKQRAQWKRELNMHPKQRAVMQRTTRFTTRGGRGG
jgi:hypothetical protein